MSSMLGGVCEWKGKYLSGCKVARAWGGPLTST